ncbi:hypothetical protein Aple_003770 [Acrocarpospora pleiomorpha]|uniref:Uncharacterized protein n=1 Tax=Acrocarpospora pleiomorpha TaxID=90975 RepID=A0A5M3X9R6_9ACTN|nr:hypothetical protein [Acrocarpospora pleiomorpha]GES17482.1 hypothetical protein Aple_003770 [Acrocarpospora pleiomorpha]
MPTSGWQVTFSADLQRVPMPAGPARTAFPSGFTGGASPGLLNEVYQWAEDNPSLVPGVPDRQRITLLKATVGGILGLPIDYYAMVDMKDPLSRDSSLRRDAPGRLLAEYADPAAPWFCQPPRGW